MRKKEMYFIKRRAKKGALKNVSEQKADREKEKRKYESYKSSSEKTFRKKGEHFH